MDDPVKICFQAIAIIGEVKSAYIESMKLARHQQFEKARELMKTADENCTLIHDVQKELSKKEVYDVLNDYRLLLIHVQDQIMSTEQLRIMAEEMNACYEKIFDLENKIDRRI